MSQFQGKWKVVSEENLDELFMAFGEYTVVVRMQGGGSLFYGLWCVFCAKHNYEINLKKKERLYYQLLDWKKDSEYIMSPSRAFSDCLKLISHTGVIMIVLSLHLKHNSTYYPSVIR